MKALIDKLYNRKMLTKLMSKDWLLKVISLVLAVLLWYYVGGEDRVDKNVMMPIEIINLPRDLVISNQFKKEIEVTVSGPRSLILEMSNRSVTRQIDLSSATPGTMVIENDIKFIPVVRGVTVQRVQPSSIILSLDKLIQKSFSVQARTIGRVAQGYQLKSIKIDPDAITIAGPQTILSQVDQLITKSINLDGAKQSVQLQIPLDLEAAIVDLIGETSVTADLIIGFDTVTITFDGLRISQNSDGAQKEIQPNEVKVVANIPKILIDKKVDLKTLLTAVTTRQEGDTKQKVKIIPRSDIGVPIEILSIVPDTVTFVNDGAESSQQGTSTSVDKITITPDPSASPLSIESDQNSESRAKKMHITVIKKNKSKIKY